MAAPRLFVCLFFFVLFCLSCVSLSTVCCIFVLFWDRGSASYDQFVHYQSNSPSSSGQLAPSPNPKNQFQKLPEVKLYKNQRERFKLDQLADMYAIIVAVEHLETVWTRGFIKDDVYEIHEP